MATSDKDFSTKSGMDVSDSFITNSDIYLDSDRHVSMFSSNGTKYLLTVEDDGSLSTTGIFSIEYLVIAGGGGGTGVQISGGGGGAGGYRCNVAGENSGGGSQSEPELSLLNGVTYNVIVGAGGIGGGSATNGSDSAFHSIVSIGGGRGGLSFTGASGLSGGSGGGASGRNNFAGGEGTSNQGFAGGRSRALTTNSAGGGGGGAGQVGSNGSDNASYPYPGGNGGNGISSSITGTSIARGGGGGGGGANSLGGIGGTGGGGNGQRNTAPTPGTVNTGGGGGGGDSSVIPFHIGQNGGSGIVILKYPASLTATFSAGVTQSTSTSGGYKISQITATSTTSETVTFS